MNWQEIIFYFIGGLGMFLVGIRSMSEGLQKTAGDKMRGLLAKYTSNPVMGVIVGIVVTGLIQSSSATTVMTVGLVNAGLMTLKQAIGIIMGANIGTTVTAFIIGIKIEQYALPIIAIGAFFMFFTRKKSAQYLGQVLFGFGLLFQGLKTMSDGVKPLADLPVFTDLMIELSYNPVLGVIVGTIFTVVVQSSSATIGILQTIADEGLIPLRAALPVLFGDNIGTTITAVLASIGASLAAKRAALVHVTFNVIGATLFTLALPLVYQAVMFIGGDVNIRMQIAFAHAMFNVTNTLIFLPMTSVLAFIVTKIIPGQVEEIDFRPQYLDHRLLATPAVALGQAQHEILRMGKLARAMLNDAVNYFFSKDEHRRNMAAQKEELINDLDRKITDYIVRIQQNALHARESGKASVLLQTINDLERIGDHAENIYELGDYIISHKVEFSHEAQEELKKMISLADETIQLALQALEHDDHKAAQKVLENERELDKMERLFRKNHITRLNNNLCTGNAGAAFLDVLSNLERIGDHSKNVAQYVLYGE
jgi:phosphate:Na+ symporter